MSVAVDPAEERYFAARQAGITATAPDPHLEVDDNGRTKLFYAGDLPWHSMGQRTDDAQTSEEAEKLAGLDWMVDIAPVWGGPNKQALANFVSIYRTSDSRVFGIAKPGYTPIQNRRMFTFLDGLVKDRTLTYEVAGALYNGRTVWMLARFAKDEIIVGDTYHRYLLCIGGHDGKTSVRVVTTDVRAVCRNTIKLALGNAGISVRVSHAGDVEAKLGRAASILKVTNEQQRRYAEWLEQMANTAASPAQVETVQTQMFGTLDEDTPTVRQHAIELWRQMLDSETERQGSNFYSVVQATTGYADHGVHYRERGDGAGKFISVLMGGAGDTLKATGLKAISAVTKVALPMTTQTVAV